MNTKSLKQKILDLAIRGKLVLQDPNDEPASVLLQRIRAEREQLIVQGKIKRTKTTSDNQHYQNVPFEIPASWEWVKLDELAQYKKGPFGSSLTKAMFVPEGADTYKVYEQKNAIQKDSTLGTYYISTEHFKRLKAFEVQPNDIIVSCAGTIGETYVLPKDIKRGVINQALMYVRLYLPIIAPFYLIYFDFIIKSSSQQDSKGTAIKNIPPFETLKNYLFPLPPLQEQARIIDEIEKWFTLIDNIEDSKRDLQEIIKATKSKVLNLAIHGKLVSQDPADEPASALLARISPHAVPCDTSHYENLPTNWTICTLMDVINLLDNKRKPIKAEERAKRIQGKTVLYPYYGATGYVGDIDEYLIDGRYILLGEDGAPFLDKYATKAYEVNGKIWVNNHAHILSPKIDFEYLLYYLNAVDYSEYAKGTTRLKLTQGDMNKILIMLPPLNEQRRISEHITNVFNRLDEISAEL